MKRWMAAVAAVALVGCASILPFLAEVISATDESALALDAIELFVTSTDTLDEDVKADAYNKLTDARGLLAVVKRMTRAIEDHSRGDVEDALNAYVDLYTELTEGLLPFGLGYTGDGERMSMSPGRVRVPKPEDLRL